MEATPTHGETELHPPQKISKSGIFYIITGVLQIFSAPLFYDWHQNEPEYMGPLYLAIVLAGSSLGLILLGAFRVASKPRINLYIAAFSVLTIVALIVSLNMVGDDMAAMEAADESDDPGFNIMGLIILFIVGPVFMFHMINFIVLLSTYGTHKSKEANKKRINLLTIVLIILPIFTYILFKELNVPTNTPESSIVFLANICLIPSGIISLIIIYFQTRKMHDD